MKADLESGAWVELRDISSLNAKDKMAMNDAIMITVDWVTQRATPMSISDMSRQIHVVMERIITSWSWEYLIPSADISCNDDGVKTYDASLMLLPIDDFNELEELARPYQEKLTGGGPKGGRAVTMATSRSNGSSKARAPSSRKA